MFRGFFYSTLALVAGAAVVAHADPKDDVTGAIGKLSAAPNYTYVVTRTFGQNSIVTTVQTEKDGYTHSSTDLGGNTIESYAKGDKSVMKNMDGVWQTPEEIAAANGGGGRRGRGGFGGPQVAPAVQLSGWADKLTNIAAGDGGVITAEVDADTAKTLAAAGGRGRRGGGGGGGAPPAPPVIKDAKATITFTIADGNIAKYDVHVTGTRTVNDEDQPIDTTTSTEVKEVGTTKIDVPDEVKAKLNA